MVNVFSFCIYGSLKKYCEGLSRNLSIINKHFSDFEIWIYYGNDVPSSYLQIYKQFNNTKLIQTHETGARLMVYRFYPIDDPKVDIMFSRDADSRINDRDIFVIKEFIKSPYSFHIVRDHPYHGMRIMGGICGMKRDCIDFSVETKYNQWISMNPNMIDNYQTDQIFMMIFVYPKIKNNVLIHSDISFFGDEVITPIEYQKTSTNFIGNVVLFDKKGEEYYEFRI